MGVFSRIASVSLIPVDPSVLDSFITINTIFALGFCLSVQGSIPLFESSPNLCLQNPVSQTWITLEWNNDLLLKITSKILPIEKYEFQQCQIVAS